MENKKGFTLVELLAVIVILGIITGISIPLIRNLQMVMQEKKYNAYITSLKTSAKLYNDSYSEDLFGHNKTGVICISYKELEEKKLIKDIGIDDISCAHENTFVRITKLEDKYTYAPYLTCGKEENRKITTIEKVLPEETQEATDDFCKQDINSTILITADETYVSNKYDKKRKKTSLTISSVTGIHNKIEIYTAWSKDSTPPSSGWEKIDFKVDGNQKEKLLKGETITTKSKDLITPQGETGKYYLHVRVVNLKDIYGNRWKNPDGTMNEYLKFGSFTVDNEKPIINNFTVVSTNSNYNDLKVKAQLNANDNQVGSNLKMCISTTNNNCNPTTTYTTAVKNLTLSGNYDGENRKVYVAVKDLAGNITRSSVDYKVALKHTLTYRPNGGNACNPNQKEIMHNKDDGKTWGTLCTPTRSGYSFKEWNTKSDGTGTKIDENTIVESNLNVYAQWTMVPPTCTLSVLGAPGNNGWYRSGVIVSLNVNGTATSKGISKTTGSTNDYTGYTENTDGTHTYYGYVKNSGGDYTCSTTFSIDRNGPSCLITATGRDGGSDWNNVSLTCTGDNASGCAGNNSATINYTQPISVYDNAGNACTGNVEYLTTTLHYIPGGATGLNILPIPSYDTLKGDAKKHPNRVISATKTQKVSFIRYIDARGNALFKKQYTTPYKLNFDVSGASGNRNGRYYGTTENGGYWTTATSGDSRYVWEYTDMDSSSLVGDLYACYFHYTDDWTTTLTRYCATGNIHDF